VGFRLTPGDYGSGVRRLSWGLLPFKVIVVAMVLAAVGGIGAALLAYWVLAIVLLFVSLAYAAMFAWILFIRPGQLYRRLADLMGEQTYCFSDSEVSWTFVSGGSQVKWSYFVDLLETKDLYLLRHPLKRLASIVPKRAFKGPDAEARFRQLVRQIGKSSQKPSPPPA
jgi:hypothetical protein